MSTASSRPARPAVTLEQRVSYLKERVYVSFIALAVLLSLGTHAAETTPGEAVAALLIAALGAGLAGLASDVIAHLAVHNALPSARELRHMLAVSSAALGTIVLPLIVLLLSFAGLVDVATAVTISVWIMAVTLGAVGYLAVARSTLTWWTKFASLGALVALGLLVIGVQVLAHG